jgi:hypothetical protein
VRHIPLPVAFSGQQGATIEVPAGGASFGGLAPEITQVANRQTVLEGQFASSYVTDFDWDRDPTVNDPANMTESHETLNGFDAIRIVHKLGSSTSSRWGGRINLPLLPGFSTGYPKGWFTFDFMFPSTHPSPRGQKLPGHYSLQTNVFHRTLAGGGTSPFTAPINGGGDAHDRLGNGIPALEWAGNPVIEFDVVWRVEMHWDVINGVLQTKADPGTANAHADPATLRTNKSGLDLYNGDDAISFMRQINYVTFHGGNSSVWNVLGDCPTVYGRFIVEI